VRPARKGRRARGRDDGRRGGSDDAGPEAGRWSTQRLRSNAGPTSDGGIRRCGPGGGKLGHKWRRPRGGPGHAVAGAHVALAPGTGPGHAVKRWQRCAQRRAGQSCCLREKPILGAHGQAGAAAGERPRGRWRYEGSLRAGHGEGGRAEAPVVAVGEFRAAAEGATGSHDHDGEVGRGVAVPGPAAGGVVALVIDHGGLVGRGVSAEAGEAGVDVGADDAGAQQGLGQLEDEAGV
jgi:hypothetical protein